MKVYVDQSGRIEYTTHDTVVAFSNGKQKAIAFKARDKRKLQNIFKQAGKKDIFAYKTLSILVYLLVKDDLRKITEIVIDKEFLGKDELIKNYFLQYLKKDGRRFDNDQISFSLIGRQCQAHKRAIAVFRKNFRPDKVIKLEEILKYIV